MRTVCLDLPFQDAILNTLSTKFDQLCFQFTNSLAQRCFFGLGGSKAGFQCIDNSGAFSFDLSIRQFNTALQLRHF